jgi:pyruvate dehydrogenase E1 component beta subunit
MARTLRFREALREAMIEEMERDDRVFLMGEEVGHYQGAYKVSEGMLEKFGERRVIDTPIAEGGFAGIGVGAAMVGLRPIVEFMTWNFSAVAFDQILNNAAKVRQMSGGQFSCPIVFRGPNASARQVGSQHSHAMEHFYATIPVLVMESETLYSIKGEVPDELDALPMGQAHVVRAGTDCTIVAYSRMTHVAIEAAAALEKEGISVEIVDLRSLRPLDEDTIVHSVRKTHRCVVVHEGWPYGGVGAEIADRVQRLGFDYLDAPILRVTTLDVPMPYNAKLEQQCMPQPERVVAAVKRVVQRGRA